MADRIQLRGDTAAAWALANPVLAHRELAIETDTLKTKIGDGVTAWNSLGYGGIVGPQGETGATGPQGPQGPQGAGLQRVASTVSGTHAISGAAGHMHDLTLTGDVTLTFPDASSSISFDLVINQIGVYAFNAVTWPTVNWSLVGGSPPALGRRNVLVRFRSLAGSWWAIEVQKTGNRPLMFVGSGFSASITEPGGTQEGDLFIAIAHGPSVSGSDSMAGWSTINDQPTISGGHTSKMYYRLRGATSLSGTAIPNANATDSSPFFAVFRGYNTVNLANTDGEIVADTATVSRTINADGAVLVWAADLFATVEPTVTLPDESLLTSGDTATYFKTRAKAGLISAGQSISVQDKPTSYGTNMWRVALTVT